MRRPLCLLCLLYVFLIMFCMKFLLQKPEERLDNNQNNRFCGKVYRMEVKNNHPVIYLKNAQEDISVICYLSENLENTSQYDSEDTSKNLSENASDCLSEYTSKNSHLPRIVLNNINTKLNKEYLVQVVLFNSTAENIFYSKGNILVRRIRTNETRKMDINIKYIFAFNTEKDDSGNYKHTFMGLYKLVHKDRFWSWERQNQNETIVSIDEESIINAIKI